MDLKKKFSNRELLSLCVIACVHFFSTMCFSIQAPFYPAEAERKGASATEYGFIFGVFDLVMFLSSPFFGSVIDAGFGVKKVLEFGMLCTSIAVILFGLLSYVESRIWFIVLSLILRIVEALGSTASVVAAFSLVGLIFPDKVATIFASCEVFYGSGLIVGPTIGGLLYGVGGFPLPFITLGLINGIVGLAILLVLPTISEDAKSGNEEKGRLWKLFKVPSILIDSFSIVAVAISYGFYQATLEPHVRKFDIPPLVVSLLFVVIGGTYAISAPFMGRLMDRWLMPKKAILWGCVCNILSFVLAGPLPFLPIPQTLTFCIVALVLNGFAMAFINVATFIDAVRSAIRAGFPDNISTYALTSGLWTSSFAFGGFLGPSIAGFLVDNVGFPYATLFVIVTHALLFVVLVIYLCQCEDENPVRSRFLSQVVAEDEEVLVPKSTVNSEETIAKSEKS